MKILRGKNAELVKFKADGRYSNHCVLKGKQYNGGYNVSYQLMEDGQSIQQNSKMFVTTSSRATYLLQQEI